MYYTIPVKDIPKEIDIRQATHGDIPALLALNAKWQRASLNGDVQKGFLSGQFDEQMFTELIDRNEVVVAMDGNLLAGYMLTVNHIPFPILVEHKEKTEEYKRDGILPADANIAIGIQTAVELDYHGSGLISLIRNEFRKLLKDRFQYFFTTIATENVRSFTSSKKYGWQEVGEQNGHHYLILTV